MRFTQAMAAAAALLTAATLGAQPAPDPARAPAPPRGGAGARPPARAGDPDAPKYDPAAVERGKQLQVTHCGFCHGSNARGGAAGTRPHAVGPRAERRERQAARRVPEGRAAREEHARRSEPARDRTSVDLATFLHATIESVSDRGKYKILDILVGDPKKGAGLLRRRRASAPPATPPTGDLQGVASQVRGSGGRFRAAS